MGLAAKAHRVTARCPSWPWPQFRDLGPLPKLVIAPHRQVVRIVVVEKVVEKVVPVAAPPRPLRRLDLGSGASVR
jgi:hypothetical protein